MLLFSFLVYSLYIFTHLYFSTKANSVTDYGVFMLLKYTTYLAISFALFSTFLQAQSQEEQRRSRHIDGVNIHSIAASERSVASTSNQTYMVEFYGQPLLKTSEFRA